MKVKKILYIILGLIGLGVGALGAILPLLPAFPFLLLTAFCFGKSSKRLDDWFKGTKLYKNNLESFVKGEGMTTVTKRKVILLVTCLMGFGFYMMDGVPIGRSVLAVVWIFHMWYFLKRVKTMEATSL